MAAEPLNLNIDPEAINRYVADRIIESTLGAQVRVVIDSTIKSLMGGYNNPIEPTIKAAVGRIISDVIDTDYKPLLLAAVRAKIDADGGALVEKMAKEALDKLGRSY